MPYVLIHISMEKIANERNWEKRRALIREERTLYYGKYADKEHLKTEDYFQYILKLEFESWVWKSQKFC